MLVLSSCEKIGDNKFRIFLPGKIDRKSLTKIADEPEINVSNKNAKWSKLYIALDISSDASETKYSNVYLTDNSEPANGKGEYSYAYFVYCDSYTKVSGEYSRLSS